MIKDQNKEEILLKGMKIKGKSQIRKIFGQKIKEVKIKTK